MKRIKIAMEQPKNISYTAIVVDDPETILQQFDIPEGWEPIAHHVTLNMGAAKNPELVGQRFQIALESLAQDDKVMAAGVRMPSDVPTVNAQPHITLAVNRANGGKPFLSNKLTNWQPLANPFFIEGTVTEVPQQ